MLSLPFVMPRRATRLGVAALVIGLALVVVACGAGPQAGPSPTTIPKPTATIPPTLTPIPIPPTTWRIVPSPNGSEYQDNALSSVSALSPVAAWAVGGNYGFGGPVTSLIEQWDGKAWHVVPSPGRKWLNGVAAVSSTDVWAVGSSGSAHELAPIPTLIEHWNGAHWIIVPSPNPSSGGNFLTSVVAVAANDVWAVGSYDTIGGAVPLIEHWNGTAWQIVSSPVVPGTGHGFLTALARIPGTQQLWAVGYTTATSSSVPLHALIERWDGSAWQVVTRPTLPSGAFGSKLNGVVALSATDAWAVGEYYGSDHLSRIFNAHWGGVAWRMVTSPDIHGSLVSVVATGPNDVRAVGRRFSSDGGNLPPLIERWDGSAWQILSSPRPGGTLHGMSLGSLTTDGAGGYWAVGDYFGGPDAHDYTVILHCP